MTLAQAPLLSAPLTAAQHGQVQRAAEAAGQSVQEFMRDAVLEAATDPFREALERAVATVARRVAEDQVQHDYAN